MSLLTVTINNASPSFEHKSSEVAFILAALAALTTEIGRGNGTVTSGSIVGTTPAGTSGSLGSWTYTPAASLP